MARALPWAGKTARFRNIQPAGSPPAASRLNKGTRQSLWGQVELALRTPVFYSGILIRVRSASAVTRAPRANSDSYFSSTRPQ